MGVLLVLLTTFVVAVFVFGGYFATEKKREKIKK